MASPLALQHSASLRRRFFCDQYEMKKPNSLEQFKATLYTNIDRRDEDIVDTGE